VPDNSIPENNVPVRRPSRFRQFGLRTLLVLVAVAAVGCLLVRNEVVREERREKLIAELEQNDKNWIMPFDPRFRPPPRLWREPIAAWLRGKPMVMPKCEVSFAEGTSLAQIREFLDLFPSVEQVEFRGADVTTEVLELLASHGPFKSIEFTNPLAIDQDTARRIAQIRCDEVQFDNQAFSDASLKLLVDAGVTFRFGSFGAETWRNISDEGLKIVARSPGFTAVHAGCLGTDEGVRALAGHPKINTLLLTGRNYTDATADVFASLPRLHLVGFTGTSHTDAGLAKAISGGNPAYVMLHNVAAGEETFAALAQDTKLIGLDLRGIDLSLAQCDILAKLPLQQLSICSESLSDEKVMRLAPLATSMWSLTLDTPQVTDAGLAWLKRAKGLQALWLHNTHATTTTWLSLSPPQHFTTGIGSTKVDTETIASILKAFRSLQIYLSGSQIDDAALELLPPGAGMVVLVDTRVTLDGLKKLAIRGDVDYINVVRDSDPASVLTAADVKQAQMAAGKGVTISFQDASMARCE
jgi:hypothetical protein